MKLVMLITAKVEAGLDVAQVWQDAGAPGVTIVRSHGLHKLQEELRSGEVELPRIIGSMGAAMAAIIDNFEERGEIILAVVDDQLVDPLIAGANNVLGDLTAPDSGVLLVLPVERAVGVRRFDD